MEAVSHPGLANSSLHTGPVVKQNPGCEPETEKNRSPFNKLCKGNEERRQVTQH